ncbi:MAG: chorismate-binding protein, partial [Thermonemataceae bacterium]
MHTKEKEPTVTSSIQIQQRFDRQTYLQTIEAIKQHILEGDIYEMNFCMEFFAEKAVIDPLATFQQLNAHSPMPFSTFLKLQHQYLLGASPERFLKKQGKQLISQPIKGTAKRSKQPTEVQQIRQQLYQSEKERAENLMIVDLVLNDLARSAAISSEKVADLFGVYSFKQVHLMISTV